MCDADDKKETLSFSSLARLSEMNWGPAGVEYLYMLACYVRTEPTKHTHIQTWATVCEFIADTIWVNSDVDAKMTSPFGGHTSTSPVLLLRRKINTIIAHMRGGLRSKLHVHLRAQCVYAHVARAFRYENVLQMLNALSEGKYTKRINYIWHLGWVEWHRSQFQEKHTHTHLYTNTALVQRPH